MVSAVISTCLLLPLFPSPTFGQDYTTESKLQYSMGQTSYPDTKIERCHYTVLQGFLKLTCLIDGRWHYKCTFSDTFYREVHVGCHHQKFTHACPDDPSFYQSCGHKPCETQVHDINRGVGVCGEVICKYRRARVSFYKNEGDRHLGYNLMNGALSQYRCDGVGLCENSIDGVPADEHGCARIETHFKCRENWVSFSIPTDLTLTFNRAGVIAEDRVCDMSCDCPSCIDESSCHNLTVGVHCDGKYVSPASLCNKVHSCMDGEDERDCEGPETCHSTALKLWTGSAKRGLNSRMKCSKLTSDYNDRGLNIYNIICDGFEDQMNCTGSLISPLTCDIKGYPTTLSEYTICSEPPLCDDGIDTVCHEIGLQCHVHKHRVCDGIPQCPGALDEGPERCGLLTPRSITCTRKLAGNRGLKISFPTSWIMDGIEDCEDGLDENGTLWTKKCGTGSTNVYTFNSTSTCDTVPLFRCPGQQSVLGVDEADMCTNFQSCDASVCTASRKPYMTNLVSHFNAVRERGRGMFHCVPGMEKIQEFLGPCHLQYHQPEFKTFGVPKPEPILTSKQYAKKLDCEQTFGEMYVTLACNKMCKKSVSCPLTRLTYSSCTNFPDSRVLTITDDYRLTVLLADKDDSYRDNVFGCSNGKCIEFASVCDLKDDCGDSSDEDSCSNNFKCTDSGEYIPKSMKCDGKFDCFDLSDECNGDCDNQVQMFKHPSLYFTAWVLGLLSVVLNIAVIYRGCQELYGLKTNIAIINKTFVTFISMGDLLQGIFLLTIAIADDLANKSTCITQFDWTTNDLCSAIGIISTTGGLISLYSMTVLSVIRAYGVGRMSAPKHGIQVREIVILIAILCVILSVASTIAIAPILPNFEDLFVTQLHYRNNRLFVGAPNKEAHIRILKDYFEGLRVRSMSWSQIRRLVREMFANTEVVGKPVGFYGINGFCLFNYFAPPNTSHFWYSGSILGGNLLCVAVITACYSYVNTVTSNSSAIAGSHNQHVQESNKRIQRNISILITTDLISWVPFITACVVHYSGVMETSKWYSIFSVLILPCNSFINPIVILDAEIRAAVGRMLAFVRSVCSGSGQGHRE